MNRPVVINLLLALTSGVLLILAFPRFAFSWLMPLALAPLLIAAGREPRHHWRFLLGWATGAACLAGVTEWIRFTVTVHGELPPLAGWGVFVLFCLAKSLYFGVFSLLAGLVLQTRGWLLAAIAATWVAVDFLFGSIGFVWITLGHAGANMGIPMRLAPITGVHGLAFVFMMMSAALVAVFLRRPRRELLWLLVLPLMILLPPLPESTPGQAQAVIVQPNVDEEMEWTSRQMVDEFHRKLVFLSMQAVLRARDEKSELILWPEVPAPIYYEEDTELRHQVGSLARVTHLPLLFGTVAHTRDGSPLNSAMLLAPNGEPVSRYDKIHLVPFGEYVPWPFGFANKVTNEIGDFKPGTRAVVSSIGNHKIGSFICYESAFAPLVRTFVRNGAELLVNLSNDGYFGRSVSAREQHLVVVRLRAAENARWIVRATNDGISASVDPAGRVVDRFPQYVQTAGRVRFSYLTGQTFYTRFGDWFAWLCVLLCVIALALHFWKKRSANAERS